jgi:hypothetical protein
VSAGSGAFTDGVEPTNSRFPQPPRSSGINTSHSTHAGANLEKRGAEGVVTDVIVDHLRESALVATPSWRNHPSMSWLQHHSRRSWPLLTLLAVALLLGGCPGTNDDDDSTPVDDDDTTAGDDDDTTAGDDDDTTGDDDDDTTGDDDDSAAPTDLQGTVGGGGTSQSANFSLTGAVGPAGETSSSSSFQLTGGP